MMSDWKSIIHQKKKKKTFFQFYEEKYNVLWVNDDLGSRNRNELPEVFYIYYHRNFGII